MSLWKIIILLGIVEYNMTRRNTHKVYNIFLIFQKALQTLLQGGGGASDPSKSGTGLILGTRSGLSGIGSICPIVNSFSHRLRPLRKVGFFLCSHF